MKNSNRCISNEKALDADNIRNIAMTLVIN